MAVEKEAEPEITLEEFREAVRDFAQGEIVPRADEIDAANEFPQDLWPKLGEQGLLGVTIPKEYGGLGLGYLHHVIAAEEISRASGGVGLSYIANTNLAMNNIALKGTEEQRAKYLPEMCSGKLVGALAMSEAGAGSDAIGSMRCRAKKEGDVWVANGDKMWITNGPEAGVLIVYMKTLNPETNKDEVTAFLVEKGMKGFSVDKKIDKISMRGSNTAPLCFENCSIPENNILGGLHKGKEVLKNGLNFERLLLAAGPIGLAQAAFDKALKYVHEREQFGKPLGELDMMKAKLADMYADLQTARAFVYQVAERADKGDFSAVDASACYLKASEMGVRVCEQAVVCLGGAGLTTEHPVGRLLKDSLLYKIGGGTEDIRKLFIGDRLYKDGMKIKQ